MAAQLQTFYPKISADIPWEVRQHFQLIYQKLNNHAQAIVDSHNTVTNTTVREIVQQQTSGGGGGGGGGSTLPGLGGINNQTGQTAYTTQSSDAGILIVLSDASSIAVTLNTGVIVPWMAFVANQGAGTATLTPQSGVVNYAGNPGAASMPLLGGYCCLIGFDGTNWWAWTEPIVPVNTPAVAHQWINAYNATTGAFTQTQPAFSDISGAVGPSQLPTPTTSTLGGIKANTPVAHEWVEAIDTTGTPQLSQPDFTDLSGTATVAQIPTLPQSQITNLTTDLAAKAPLASPTFTGTVTQPDATVLTAATTATSATAGSASALPATPAGYLQISINGTNYKVPYFDV